jgi:hypothetical protein
MLTFAAFSQHKFSYRLLIDENLPLALSKALRGVAQLDGGYSRDKLAF